MKDRLVMLLTVPEDCNPAEAGKKYSDSSPRIKEWGEMMNRFQVTSPEASEGSEGWSEMKLVYQYKQKRKGRVVRKKIFSRG